MMATRTAGRTQERHTVCSVDYGDDGTRWRALLQRDAGADDHFVYAVRTTGIFCRPSCRSRHPLRRNVEFFSDSQIAKGAGYRECKRCRPTGVDPRRERERTLVTACRLLEATDGRARSDEVAAAVGLSAYYFQRFFKKELGVSPQEYRRRVLSERAKSVLMDGKSVTEAVYSAGYSSSSRFYDGPARELGMTAREARAGAHGQTVRYALRTCSLGHLLVAWTERGVCDVRFAHTESDAVHGLSERFPGAVVGPAASTAWIDAVAQLVERPFAKVSIPLDVQGTAFQERVWQELRRIPCGETKSYSELARAIGTPTAARAVARACATNSLAILVPCHRVVRSDGSLSGYRWGTERKKELLRREKTPTRLVPLT